MNARCRLGGLLVAVAALPAFMAHARDVVIQTPGGPITIRVSHLGPSGSLVAPPSPEPLTFRPPSVFSAPLPSGSGARALGMAGAFTALADDATAASWNPAGLVQLERPEASFVVRLRRARADHHSDDEDFQAGSDRTEDEGLNYFSLAYPFFVPQLKRNVVVSLNHQEAYDFEQHFDAHLEQRSTEQTSGRTTSSYQSTQEDIIRDNVFNVTVTSHLTTEVESRFNQLLKSEMLSDLEFDQEGVISAITPAFGVEINPRFLLGASFNWYQIDPLAGDEIRSRTRARYTGSTTGQNVTRTTRSTSGDYSYKGAVTLPPGGGIPFPIKLPIKGGGAISPFSDASSASQRQALPQEGLYEEENTFKDLEGYNFTLGGLWTVSSLLSVGASVDLPWTAETRQTKVVRNTVNTFNAAGTRVLDTQVEEQREEADVELDFPLFWNLGLILRWTPSFYTTLDAGQTRWSDFAYQAAGGEEINPLDGSPHGEHPLDDCWSVRAGAEYLFQFRSVEIPLRVGLAQEQRPALDQPDDFFTATCGTGLALGKDPGRTIVDVAYAFTWADGVRGLVPARDDLRSDIEEHQVYVSVIQHF